MRHAGARPPGSPGRLPTGVASLIALAMLAGCGGASIRATPDDASGSGSPRPTATLGSTASSSEEPSDVPTTAPSTAPTELAGASPASLPVGEIVTPGGTIVGTLGTYAIDGHGSDAPWLPFGSLPWVTSGPAEVLTIRFADGTEIGDVAVTIAAAEDLSGSNPRGVESAVPAADETTLSIGPVPRGRWVLAIRLFRADGRGDGLTYWALTVR